ncbi:hypothetical protein RJ639_020992 [Escallonia herrerae]|uniref:Fungal lipase-like domain-containing protein n=1 Tax=Escallonia herrerae TaxID=1293975 RepID=A0AA88V269_9ASTE|nr:hypothetical protein RJ639_020992 [Escallonia herrerae]
MASEIFGLSGPFHLTVVDWKNIHHRRSIAASLVQGVYTLECDRQESRQGPYALAPPWWDFFHFQLIRVLVDEADHSIFGAIYEFRFPSSYPNHHFDQHQNSPRFVIAFRGTIPKSSTRSQDLMLDLKVIRNRLEESSRFPLAMQAVQNMVTLAGAANTWLAGHSLGSAIALLAGRNMVKMGCHLESYLFNPPFISAPVERIKHENLKHGVRFLSSAITAGLAVAVNGRGQSSKTRYPFAALSTWIPYLFVNPSDPICSEYVGYFEHREKMVNIGAGAIGRLATQNSVASLLSGALGQEMEPSHLLPSAYMTINRCPCSDIKQAHGIQQWWKLETTSTLAARLHQFT